MAATSAVDPKPLIAHYLRTGLARAIITTCDDSLKRRGNDAAITLWRAVAYGREGNTAAAIRDLEGLRGKRDSDVAALAGLRYYHRASKVPDTEAADAADAAWEVTRSKGVASAAGSVLAATFLWQVAGDVEGAAEVVGKVLRESPEHEGATTLKGWLALSCGPSTASDGLDGGMGGGRRGLVTPSTPSPYSAPALAASCGAGLGDVDAWEAAEETRLSEAVACFEAVIASGGGASGGGGGFPTSHIEAHMGLAAVYERRGQYGRAVDEYNTVLAAHNWFLPAAYEQARVYTKACDLDNAADTLARVLQVDPTNIPCLRLQCLHALLRAGAGSLKTVSLLQELMGVMGKVEPRNGRLLYDIARVCARLSCRSRSVLSVTLAMMDAAIKLDPDVSAYHCEVGAQRLMTGDAAGAASAYRQAAAVDETDPDAVTGMIAVQLCQGLLDDADAQLEMFTMISESVGGKHPATCLLQAQVAWRKYGDREKAKAAIAEGLHGWCDGIGLLSSHAAAPATAAGDEGGPHPFVRIVAGDADATLGPDGLPLPLMLPGARADVYDWYYHASPDMVLDLARELLLQSDARGQPTPATSFAELLAAQPHDDVQDQLTPPASVAAAAAVTASLGRGVAVAVAEGNPPATRLVPGVHGLAVLSLATGVQPCHDPAWLTAATVFAACRSWGQATAAVHKALQLNPAFTDGHLLLAHIGLAQGDPRLAAAALEAALAQSFAVQDTPAFLRMKAAVLLAQRKYEECVTVCEAAMRMPGVRRGRAGGGGAATTASPPTPSPISLHDRANLFLTMAEALLCLDRIPEATKMVTDAMAEFSGTAEEGPVRVASARLAMQRGDADTALSLLAAIAPGSLSYPAAQVVKADICLTHRGDRRAFIQCYADVVARSRTEASLIALGEAYMRIQMPEEAIGAYEQALSLRPSNIILACRIGRALSLMHDYRRAITYYTSALASADGEGGGVGLSGQDVAVLRSDLTELLVKLRAFDQAQALIQQALAQSSGAALGSGGGDGGGGAAGAMAVAAAAAAVSSSDMVNLRLVRKNLTLLHRVYAGMGNQPAAAEALTQAYAVSEKVLSLARRDPAAAAMGLALTTSLSSPPSATATIVTPAAGATGGSAARGPPLLPPPPASPEDVERVETATIALALGKWYENEATPRQDVKAREYYTEAAEVCEGVALTAPAATTAGGGGGSGSSGAPPTLYETCMLALASLHLRRGDVDACRSVCSTLTTANPGCEQATIMLADLLFRQNDAAAATYHFTALLDKTPNNYDALARLLELLKRAGKASEGGKYLKLAVRAHPAAETNDAGYKYCAAMLSQYSNQPAEAIKGFNAVRLSGAWGVPATERMVRIYLSPDNDPLWSTGREGDESGRESLMESLTVARKLLGDIPPPSRTRMHEVLSCHILIATRLKASVEEAITALVAMLDADPDYHPALMALAAAYMVTGQTPKARNLAKRVLKLPFDAVHVDEVVMARLLLAEMHIETGKYDQAGDELKAALEVDASCARAYEYLGAIAEKEVRYAEAAECYEKAWRFENENSAPVAYKLAFNYLKAERYVPAIDVCHKILDKFPAYSKIKTEVMDKARAAVRS